MAVSAPIATVIAAGCGLVGAVVGAAVTGYFDRESNQSVAQTEAAGALGIEELKFQAELILKAIDTDDQPKAVKTLKFFANAGLIPLYADQVLKLTETDEGSAIPALRPPSYQAIDSVAPEIARIGVNVVVFQQNNRPTCTGIVIKGGRVIVPNFCLPEDSSVAELSVRLFHDSVNAETLDLTIDRIDHPSLAGLTVLMLADNLPAIVSGLDVSSRAPVPGEAVFMIHHPFGQPKTVSSDCSLHANPIVDAERLGFDERSAPEAARLLQFSCLSEGGSAGAPIIAVRDHAIIGVHTSGIVGDTEQSTQLFGVPSVDFIEAARDHISFAR